MQRFRTQLLLSQVFRCGTDHRFLWSVWLGFKRRSDAATRVGLTFICLRTRFPSSRFAFRTIGLRSVMSGLQFHFHWPLGGRASLFNVLWKAGATRRREGVACRGGVSDIETGCSNSALDQYRPGRSTVRHIWNHAPANATSAAIIRKPALLASPGTKW